MKFLGIRVNADTLFVLSHLFLVMMTGYCNAYATYNIIDNPTNQIVCTIMTDKLVIE